MKWIRDIRVWIGIGFILFLVALRFSGITDHITLDSIQNQREFLVQYIQQRYWWSVFLYIIFYIGIVVAALPLAALSTVAGGYIFGLFPTVIYTNIGATIGATIFFLMVRYLFGKSLQMRYHDRLRWFNAQMDEYGVMYLIAIHFVAVIPFFVMNLLIGMTNVSLWTFIWTTSVGVIPGAFVYAFAGKQLTTISSLQDIFSPNVLLAFAFLTLLALFPAAVHYYRTWKSD